MSKVLEEALAEKSGAFRGASHDSDEDLFTRVLDNVIILRNIILYHHDNIRII